MLPAFVLPVAGPVGLACEVVGVLVLGEAEVVEPPPAVLEKGTHNIVRMSVHSRNIFNT